MPKRVFWRRVLIAGLFVHLAYATARIPHAVVWKRITEVGKYHERGAVRYHLDRETHKGAVAVQWVLDHVPEDEVVLYEGEQKGALEFVPPLIFPRLLVAVGGVAAGAESFAGRRIAHGTSPAGKPGKVVLVGRGDRVDLEFR